MNMNIESKMATVKLDSPKPNQNKHKYDDNNIIKRQCIH